MRVTRNGQIGVLTATAAIVSALATSAAYDAAAQATASARILASVGGRTVLSSDVDDELAALRRRQAAESRLDAFTSSARTGVLERLIDIKLLASEATARKLDQRADVRHHLDNLADEYLAALVIADATQSVPTDPASLHRYYDAHAADFAPPSKRRARHLVVKTQEEAETLVRALAAGGDFATLARTHNVDATRNTDGELGWVSRGVMVPAFEAALFALHAGETSAIVHTSFGYHIVQLEEIEPAKVPPFEQVADAVKSRMLESRLDELKQQLRAKYAVRVDNGATYGNR